MNYQEIKKELTGSNETDRYVLSSYFEVQNVNIRISNHLPKVHNLVEYSETLTETNGVIKMYLILITDELKQHGLEDVVAELSIELAETLSKEVEISSIVFEKESDVDEISILLMKSDIERA